MKKWVGLLCLGLILSGCSNQREAERHHDIGLHFNELNNLYLVTKIQDNKHEALDVYVNNKKVVSELENNDMALVASDRDYITTRPSTTHRRYKNFNGYLHDHANEDLEEGKMIVYDFKKKDQTRIVGKVLIALFDSGENFIEAKTFSLTNAKKQRFKWVYTRPYCYAEVTVLAYKK